MSEANVAQVEKPKEDQLPTMPLPSLAPDFAAPDAPRAAKPAATPPAPRSAPPAQRSTPAWWDEKPKWWWMFLPLMFLATARPATAADDARYETLLRRRIGFAAGLGGVVLVMAALVLGYASLATERFPEKPEQLVLALAIVVAHAAITIAAVYVGYSMLRAAERMLVPSRAPATDLRRPLVAQRVSEVRQAVKATLPLVPVTAPPEKH
jgi:hypothetical protein